MRFYPHTLRLLIISLIAALVAVSLFSFLLFVIERGSREARELWAAVERGVLAEQQFLSQKILLQNTQKEREEIDRRFLAHNAIASFLERVEELGSIAEADVKVKSVNAETAGEGAVTETLLVSLEAVGRWEHVFHYLALLESMPLPITVVKSLMSVSGSSEEENVWRGSFDIVIEALQ
jgi:hypothetical protein